jgi:hypothetical protein
MTSNQSTQKVFCFERNAMLAGTPGARSIYVNYTPPKSGFFVPLPLPVAVEISLTTVVGGSGVGVAVFCLTNTLKMSVVLVLMS